MKTISIEISPNGETTIEVSGVPGKRCLKYINKLKEALDATTLDEEKTPEYYAQESVDLYDEC